MNAEEIIQFGQRQVEYFANEKQKYHWKSEGGEYLEGKEYEYRQIVENITQMVSKPEIQAKLAESKLFENVKAITRSEHFEEINELFMSLARWNASVSEHFEANKAKYHEIWGLEPPPVNQSELDREYSERIAKIEAERLETERLEAIQRIVCEEKITNATISMDEFVEKILPLLSDYGVSNHRIIASRKYGYRTELRDEWIGEFEGFLNSGGIGKIDTNPHLELSVDYQSNPYDTDKSTEKLESFNLIHSKTGKKLFISVSVYFVAYGEEEISYRFEGDKEIVEKFKEEINTLIAK